MASGEDDRIARRKEFAKSWPLILGSFVGMMLGVAAIPLYVAGPLVRAMQADFGWSDDVLFACAALLSAGVTLASPVVGRLADRVALRIIGVVSLSALAACFTCLRLISGPAWQIEMIYFLLGFLGAGSGGIIYTKAIGARLAKARGIALGIILSSTGLTSFAAPLLVQWVQLNYGWRTVGPAIGGVILLIALPLVWFTLPSSCPLPVPSSDQPASAFVTSGGSPPSRALRDIRFYIILGSASLFGLLITSAIINIFPALVERGIASERAAQIASALGIAIIVGRLGVGYLLDHIRPAIVGVGIFMAGAAGAALFALATGNSAIMAVIFMGLLIGAEIDLMSFMVLWYFGVRSFGAIFGILFSLYTGTTIAGPILGAVLLRSGGYPLLYISTAATFVMAALAMLALCFVGPSRDGVST